MASDIKVLQFGRQGEIVNACDFFTASIVPFERSGLTTEESPLAGLALALFVAFSTLVLYVILGRILALFLAATRREVPLLDCTAHDADTLDIWMMLEGLLPNNSQANEAVCPQKRKFEWIDTPPEDEYAERLYG